MHADDYSKNTAYPMLIRAKHAQYVSKLCNAWFHWSNNWPTSCSALDASDLYSARDLYCRGWSNYIMMPMKWLLLLFTFPYRTSWYHPIVVLLVCYEHLVFAGTCSVQSNKMSNENVNSYYLLSILTQWSRTSYMHESVHHRLIRKCVEQHRIGVYSAWTVWNE